MDKSRKTVWRIVLIIATVLFIASAVCIILYVFPRPTAPLPGESGPSMIEPLLPSTSEPVPEENLPDNPVDFTAEQQARPSTAAWIQIPDTVINYPIMQSSGEQKENFYLDHRPDGSSHKEGSIYIQKRNAANFEDPNTVIYGHNMATGRMFAAIRRYQYKDFFEQHRYITVFTPGHILTYEVYSAFVYDNRHILNSFNFSDKEDYAAFLQQTLHPTSMTHQVREGVTPTTDDRIITLSTCTGRSSERFLVVGVLINDQRTK